jgi:CRP-like cAMP-binding protein
MLSEPKLQQLLFGKLIAQVRDAQKRILMLGQQNIHQRLASFLLEFLNVPAFYDAKQARLILPVNRFDIADYLGTAPESTARAFVRLENEGLVKRIGTRMIEIRDLAGLHASRNERRRTQR